MRIIHEPPGAMSVLNLTLIESRSWYRGDRSLILRNGCPAIAVQCRMVIREKGRPRGQRGVIPPQNSPGVILIDEKGMACLHTAGFTLWILSSLGDRWKRGKLRIRTKTIREESAVSIPQSAHPPYPGLISKL